MADLGNPLYPQGPSNTLGNVSMDDNFKAAASQMQLTESEKQLYRRHLNNLHGPGGVDNSDGTRSTLYAQTVSFGDKTFIIPTVANGRKLDTEEAINQAKKEGIDKFPSYNSVEEAEERYNKMHEYMEKDTIQYQKDKN